ncbi:MAG: hypothetical protein RL344_672 [Pseudomonadota bacterium]|jgi:hypothetical protein
MIKQITIFNYLMDAIKRNFKTKLKSVILKKHRGQ